MINMARTFISQPNQVFKTEQYDDTLAPGAALQSDSTNLESDLNALRSQIRKILWAGVSGSWYDAVTTPSGSNSARGLNTLNSDLSDLEQKRFLFRQQNLNLVNVATGSNYALLSPALGNAPANFIVASHPLSASTLATGSLVALLAGTEGTYGSHSLALTSGSSVLTPKNLVIVRDFWSGQRITGSSGRDIYGLLQLEEGGTTGESFNDVDRRTQISFVIEQVINATSSLSAAPTGLIGGKSISYSYVRRVSLDDIPEDAYLSDSIFVDYNDGNSVGTVGLSDITLDRAIDNQVGIASQDQNIDIRLAAGVHWAFLSGTKELWRLDSSDSNDVLTVAVDRFSVSSSFASTFQSGISVSTGSTPINIGHVAGTIATLSGSNLVLSGGAQLNFSDIFGPQSTVATGMIPLATSTLQWNEYASSFGQRSLLGALTFLSQSLSSSMSRLRFVAGVNTSVAPDTNITFPTNLDAPLGSLVGKDFKQNVNIYFNGLLLVPGNTLEANDVYPGDDLSSGDLKFPYLVRSGSQITMEIFA